MSRDINDLKPWFQPKAKALQAACYTAGIDTLIYSTFRRDDVQHVLWAIGRRTLTVPEEILLRKEGLYPASQEKPVTNAETSTKTAHGWGLGFDIVPVKSGQPDWGASKETWDEIHKIAKACGLDTDGGIKGDFGHMEEPGWRLYVIKEELGKIA